MLSSNPLSPEQGIPQELIMDHDDPLVEGKRLHFINDTHRYVVLAHYMWIVTTFIQGVSVVFGPTRESL